MGGNSYLDGLFGLEKDQGFKSAIGAIYGADRNDSNLL